MTQETKQSAQSEPEIPHRVKFALDRILLLIDPSRLAECAERVQNELLDVWEHHSILLTPPPVSAAPALREAEPTASGGEVCRYDADSSPCVEWVTASEHDDAMSSLKSRIAEVEKERDEAVGRAAIAETGGISYAKLHATHDRAEQAEQCVAEQDAVIASRKMSAEEFVNTLSDGRCCRTVEHMQNMCLCQDIRDALITLEAEALSPIATLKETK